jgi:hypothetical protein
VTQEKEEEQEQEGEAYSEPMRDYELRTDMDPAAQNEKLQVTLARDLTLRKELLLLQA